MRLLPMPVFLVIGEVCGCRDFFSPYSFNSDLYGAWLLPASTFVAVHLCVNGVPPNQNGWLFVSETVQLLDCNVMRCNVPVT